MANRLTIPVSCHPSTKSTITIPCDAPSDAQITALHGAIDGLILGIMGEVKFVTETPKDGAQVGVPPNTAKRGSKFVGKYQDNIDASLHEFELPAADSTLLPSNSNEVDLTAGAGLTFKTAFEAAAASPSAPGQGGGNAVTLLSLTYVSRSIQ